MPRYFFHIKDGDETTTDNEGSDLLDLDAAREEATQAARQIMSWAVLAGRLPYGRVFVITDENGNVLLDFPFRNAFDAS